MCSFQRPGRAAGRAANGELKGHPRAQTRAEKEPFLFLWPLGPVMKPGFLATWGMGDKVRENQEMAKVSVYEKNTVQH